MTVARVCLSWQGTAHLALLAAALCISAGCGGKAGDKGKDKGKAGEAAATSCEGGLVVSANLSADEDVVGERPRGSTKFRRGQKVKMFVKARCIKVDDKQRIRAEAELRLKDKEGALIYSKKAPQEEEVPEGLPFAEMSSAVKFPLPPGLDAGKYLLEMDILDKTADVHRVAGIEIELGGEAWELPDAKPALLKAYFTETAEGVERATSTFKAEGLAYLYAVIYGAARSKKTERIWLEVDASLYPRDKGKVGDKPAATLYHKEVDYLRASPYRDIIGVSFEIPLSKKDDAGKVTTAPIGNWLLRLELKDHRAPAEDEKLKEPPVMRAEIPMTIE